MKIGILTFHRAVNYGAVLQAYALQQVILLMGHDAEIIDYRCPFIESEVSPLAGFKNKVGFVSAVKQMIFRCKKNIAFDMFMKKYMNLSKKYSEGDNLSLLEKGYDAFITGSDQVWNYGCSGSDTTYFLDFVKEPRKKNSYAASFGFDRLPNGDPFDYKKLLSDFNKMSVREKSASKIVEEKIGEAPVVTLDPTLILGSEEWKKLILGRPCKEKYIFVYYIREPKDLLDYAYKLGKEKGCKVINSKRSIEFLEKCSPQDFLTWFYHAEYVVTNSFHGTVFSILFEKQFAIELDNGKSINNRSKELLQLLEITGREVEIDNLNKIENTIDYAIAKKRLEDNKNKSLGFVESIFEN